MKHSICVVLCAVSLVACASTTRIITDPEGARVYINGERVGVTPYSLTDRKTWIHETHVTLKKDGYKDMTVTLQRDGDFNCLGALIYTAWIWDYKPVHKYEMERLNP